MEEVYKKYGSSLTRWVIEYTPSEPHQQLIPWLGWFRPMSARRPEFMAMYPDDEFLHP